MVSKVCVPSAPAARGFRSRITALGSGTAGRLVPWSPGVRKAGLPWGAWAERTEVKPWLSLPQEAELERLEREFAIQSQITEAARRLASDPNVSKKLKKQRKTSYLNALKKLQEIENAINENRIKSGKKPTQRASLIIDGQC